MKKIYLDSCIYISILNSRSDKRYVSILTEELEQGSALLIASTLVALEVHTEKLGRKGKQKWKEFLKEKTTKLIPPGFYTCSQAANLIHDYGEYKIDKSIAKGISAIDALHLQTAIEQGVDEFHTLDQAILNININAINVDSGIKIIPPNEYHTQ